MEVCEVFGGEGCCELVVMIIGWLFFSNLWCIGIRVGRVKFIDDIFRK